MQKWFLGLCAGLIALGIGLLVRHYSDVFVANPYAMGALIIAAIVGNELGYRRVIRLSREKHTPTYMRRWFLGNAVGALLFALAFVVIIATFKTANAQPSIALLAYAIPAYLIFMAWQNWNRYTAER